jgi:hypothetical protein
MNTKLVGMVCALTMLTTGFMGCIPASAENDSASQDSSALIDGPAPLMAYHTTVYSLWRVYWYDCDPSYPTGGTHITGAFYNGFLMISEAFQTGIRIKIVNGAWYDISVNNATCSYWQGQDAQGRMRYGSQFIWHNLHYGNGYYTFTYTPSFALTTTSILLYQTFRWYATGNPTGVANLTGWWKTYYPQGTVWKDGDTSPLSHEYADEPLYWSSEKFKKDDHHNMYTNSYGFGGPNGYFKEGWAAFQTIEYWFKYWENKVPAQSLTYPSGGDFVDIDNNGYTLWQNQDYFFDSIWVATASD